MPTKKKSKSKIKKRRRTIIIIVLLVLGVAALGLFLNNDIKFINNIKGYSIPDNYVSKVQNHLSQLDGSDTDYYIYHDKIIADTNSYAPSGAPCPHRHEIVLYADLTLAEIQDYKSYLVKTPGKVVLDRCE